MITDSNWIDIALKAAIEAGQKTLVYYNDGVEVNYKTDESPLTRADLESNAIICNYLDESGLPILSEENTQTDFSERRKWELFWLVDPLDGTKEFIKKSNEYTINIALVHKQTPIFGVVYVPATDILYYGIVGEGSYKVEDVFKNDLSSKIAIESRRQSLPLKRKHKTYRVVASKSHMSDETQEYIDEIKKEVGEIELCSYGSSLKLCMVAEGSADLYPRQGPTMEWDTAASHAVVKAAGGQVLSYPENTELVYNKENLLNPWFVVKGV